MHYPGRYIIALIGTILFSLLQAPLPALARETHIHAISAGEASATIWQSASTNTCSSLLQITSTGFSTYLLCQRTRGQGMAPQALTNALFQDLKAAQPLNELSLAPICLKPASFAVTIYIVYANQISPDLNCVENNIGKQLVGDVYRIQKALWGTNDLWINH